ncbi:MAG: Aspartokinase, partial [uncultured Rubrobacteraceae bacterium]
GHRGPEVRRQLGCDGRAHKSGGRTGQEGPGGGARPRRGRFCDGEDHRQAARARERGKSRARAARDRPASLDRGAPVRGAPGDGAARSRGRRDLTDRAAGRDGDDGTLRLRRHLHHQDREDEETPRRWPGRHRRRVPGYERGRRRGYFGTRRLGHDGRRARGGPVRRALRGLHGRHRGFHRRPEDSSRCPAHPAHLPRRDGRDGVARGEGHAPEGGRARGAVRRRDTRQELLLGGAGHHHQGGQQLGASGDPRDPGRHRPRPRRLPDNPDRHPDRPRHHEPHLRAPGRAGRLRRRHRRERAEARRLRRRLHRGPRRLPRRPQARRGGRGHSGRRGGGRGGPRQGQRRRDGDAQPARVRRKDVRLPGEGRHPYTDGFHLGDTGDVRGPGGKGRRGGSHPARGLRARRDGGERCL